MNAIKVLKAIGYLIVILSLPVMLLSASLAWGFNSHWLYTYGFDKYGVSQATGIPNSELDKTATTLINYFNNGDELIQVEVTAGGKTFDLFTPDEQLHFKDVKSLVRLDYTVFFVSLAVLVVLSFLLVVGDFRKNWRALAKAYVWGSLVSIVLIIVIAIASFFDFDNLFLQFHYLAFTNDLWSSNGYMLLLFPGDFWYAAAFICIGFMAALAILWGGISFFFIKWDDRRQFWTH